MKQKQLVYLMTIVFGVILILPLLEYNLSLLNNSAIIIDPVNNIPQEGSIPTHITNNFDLDNALFTHTTSSVDPESSIFNEYTRPVWEVNSHFNQQDSQQVTVGDDILFTREENKYRFNTHTISVSDDGYKEWRYDVCKLANPDIVEYLIGSDDETDGQLIGSESNGHEWEIYWNDAQLGTVHEDMFLNTDYTGDDGTTGENEMFLFWRQWVLGVQMPSTITSKYTYTYDNINDASNPTLPYVEEGAENEALTYTFSQLLSSIAIQDNNYIPFIQQYILKPAEYRIVVRDVDGNSIPLSLNQYHIHSPLHSKRIDGVSVNWETEANHYSSGPGQFAGVHHLHITHDIEPDTFEGWPKTHDGWDQIENLRENFGVEISVTQKISSVEVTMYFNQDDDIRHDENYYSFGTPAVHVTGDVSYDLPDPNPEEYELPIISPVRKITTGDSTTLSRHLNVPSNQLFPEDMETEYQLINDEGSSWNSDGLKDINGDPLDFLTSDGSVSYQHEGEPITDMSNGREPLNSGLEEDLSVTYFTITADQTFLIDESNAPYVEFALNEPYSSLDYPYKLEYSPEDYELSDYFAEYHFIKSDGSAEFIWDLRCENDFNLEFTPTGATSSYPIIFSKEFQIQFDPSIYDIPISLSPDNILHTVQNSDELIIDATSDVLSFTFKHDEIPSGHPDPIYITLQFIQDSMETPTVNQVSATNDGEYVTIPAFQLSTFEEAMLKFDTTDDRYSQTVSDYYSAIYQTGDVILGDNLLSVDTVLDGESPLYNIYDHWVSTEWSGSRTYSLYAMDSATKSQCFTDGSGFDVTAYSYNLEDENEPSTFLPDDENPILTLTTPSTGTIIDTRTFFHEVYQFGDPGSQAVQVDIDLSDYDIDVSAGDPGEEVVLAALDHLTFESPIYTESLFTSFNGEDFDPGAGERYLDEVRFMVDSNDEVFDKFSNQQIKFNEFRIIPRDFDGDENIYFMTDGSTYGFTGAEDTKKLLSTLSVDNLFNDRTLLMDIVMDVTIQCDVDSGELAGSYSETHSDIRVSTPIIFARNQDLKNQNNPNKLPVLVSYNEYQAQDVPGEPQEFSHEFLITEPSNEDPYVVLGLIQDENLIHDAISFGSDYFDIPTIAFDEDSIVWNDENTDEKIKLFLTDNSLGYEPKLRIQYNGLLDQLYDMEEGGGTDEWQTLDSFDPGNFRNDEFDIIVELWFEDNFVAEFFYDNKLQILYYFENAFGESNFGGSVNDPSLLTPPTTWGFTYDSDKVIFEYSLQQTQIISTDGIAAFKFSEPCYNVELQITSSDFEISELDFEMVVTYDDEGEDVQKTYYPVHKDIDNTPNIIRFEFDELQDDGVLYFKMAGPKLTRGDWEEFVDDDTGLYYHTFGFELYIPRAYDSIEINTRAVGLTSWQGDYNSQNTKLQRLDGQWADVTATATIFIPKTGFYIGYETTIEPAPEPSENEYQYRFYSMSYQAEAADWSGTVMSFIVAVGAFVLVWGVIGTKYIKPKVGLFDRSTAAYYGIGGAIFAGLFVLLNVAVFPNGTLAPLYFDPINYQMSSASTGGISTMYSGNIADMDKTALMTPIIFGLATVIVGVMASKIPVPGGDDERRPGEVAILGDTGYENPEGETIVDKAFGGSQKAYFIAVGILSVVVLSLGYIITFLGPVHNDLPQKIGIACGIGIAVFIAGHFLKDLTIGGETLMEKLTGNEKSYYLIFIILSVGAVIATLVVSLSVAATMLYL